MLALSSLLGIWTLSQICCLKHTLSFFPLSHWLFFISFCNFHWKMSTVMLIMSETKTLSKSFLFAHFLFSLETVLPLARCLLTAIQPATKPWPALKTEVNIFQGWISFRDEYFHRWIFSLETVLPLARCLLTAGNQTLASIENRGCETKVLCCDYLLFLAFVAELFTFW